jgi:hypothetical protein
MATAKPPGLHVVPIRFRGHEPVDPADDPVSTYAAAGAFDRLGASPIVEPTFPEERRGAAPTGNLGPIGDDLAAAAAEGRRAGKPVLAVDGNRAAVTGGVGGLPEAHGPDARPGPV